MTIKQQQLILGIVFLGIPLLWMLIWVVAPIFVVFYMSFTTYDVLSPMRWAGTWNYTDLWYDDLFWRAIGNTLYFTAVSLPAGVFLSLMLAVLVNRQLPFVGLFRTIFYMPVVTPLIAAALAWILFYETSAGMFNYTLDLLGISPVNWLNDQSTAMPAIIIMSVWKSLGYNMVIFLAALQSVPKELGEAAAIDGAGPVRRFWSITLPMLTPAMVYVVITSLIASFQVFAQVRVMTDGGPNNSTVTIVHYIYRTAFQNLQFGYASAMATIMFFLLIVASFVNLRLVGRRNVYD
ncbi:sugar ABC transporter permease [Oceanicola granulosus HTCC2516]|uniref:Sugar ABC transporter permease n=1 Tax=Oceanicola granulosus (strain ATCC BAA-861 / DSM 15982 / KCTC 12143 / HTCC2516) TaxID=314256 RepID=Q2CHC5_OCEGH|nr:sugar ABC transporter permease [Oceanicola granulosus]EAR52114.1 sugar ABC transporter permease [Oceanicola granulosus HTCC2516]